MIKFITIYTMSLMLVGIRPAWSDSVAVFFALDQDLATLRSAGADAAPPLRVGGVSIGRLKIGPHLVYTTQMGSGCVESALAAQALLTRFHCDCAVSIGPAGALSATPEVGAWYRVGRIAAWQRLGDDAGEGSNSHGAIWEPDVAPLAGVRCGTTPHATSTVTLISGECFIDRAAQRDELAARWRAELVDMNGFGVAAACRSHRVPLYVWRVVSDRADEEAQQSFRSFVSAYDGAGGRAVAEWIRALPPNPEAAGSYEEIRAMMGDGEP